MRHILLILLYLVSLSTFAFAIPNMPDENEGEQPQDGIFNIPNEGNEEISEEDSDAGNSDEQWYGPGQISGEIDKGLTESQKYFV